MTDAELAWCAGIFEGEGTIHKKKNQLEVCSTDIDMLELFQQRIGVGRLYTRTIKSNKLSKKPMFCWGVYNRIAVKQVLEAFLPWLCERRLADAQTKLAMIARSLKPIPDRTTGVN